MVRAFRALVFLDGGHRKARVKANMLRNMPGHFLGSGFGG